MQFPSQEINLLLTGKGNRTYTLEKNLVRVVTENFQGLVFYSDYSK